MRRYKQETAHDKMGRHFPEGTRVIKKGRTGTIVYIDDNGNAYINFDDGEQGEAIYNVDFISKI